jgi:dTDP-4-dehydrorhamnose 3,5-epimerase
VKIKKTEIDGILIFEPDVFEDSRGYFFESYSDNKYSELGKDFKFVQDNFSKSIRNTIRGLHYQAGEKSQGKLCSTIFGEVLDVAVDIRFGSPTFGKHVSVILSSQSKNQIWIPPGFAHGFAVLSEEAIFHYKCTNFYNSDAERTILYNDSQLNIFWQVDDPIISPKDLQGVPFNQINKDFLYNL